VGAGKLLIVCADSIIESQPANLNTN